MDRFDLFVDVSESQSFEVVLFLTTEPLGERFEATARNRKIDCGPKAITCSVQAERIGRIASRIRIISSFVCLQFARRCTT